MSRNDRSLYSGINSSNFTSVRTNRVIEASEAKQAKQNKLAPEVEIILDMIANEKAEVIKQISRLPIGIETTEEAVKSALMAYQLNLQFIDQFSMKLANVMRKGGR